MNYLHRGVDPLVDPHNKVRFASCIIVRSVINGRHFSSGGSHLFSLLFRIRTLCFVTPVAMCLLLTAFFCLDILGFPPSF